MAGSTGPNLGEYFSKNLLASVPGLVAVFVAGAEEFEAWKRCCLSVVPVVVSSARREKYFGARRQSPSFLIPCSVFSRRHRESEGRP